MANTIDYKAYLATLGKVETDAKSRIKDYLEKQIQDDGSADADLIVKISDIVVNI